MRAPNSHFQLIFCCFNLLLLSLNNVQIQAMSSITAMARDQIACEMCSTCENPCQPILSPPPPSPSPPLPCPPPPSPPLPPPPPPPSLPPPSLPEYSCPPPPSPPRPCPGDCFQPLTPPNNNPSIYPTTPFSPNSFYPYNSHPSANSSKSIHIKNNPFAISLVLGIAYLCFFL